MEYYKLEMLNNKDEVILLIPMQREDDKFRVTWESYSRGDTTNYYTHSITFDELSKLLEDREGYISTRTAQLLQVEYNKHVELSKKIDSLNNEIRILRAEKGDLLKTIKLVRNEEK